LAPASKAAPTLDAAIAKVPETPAGPRLYRRRLPGNQALLRTEEPGIQTKVAIGRRDDPLEREADATADRIMRMTSSDPPSPAPAPSQIQRADGALEEESDEREVQRKAAGPAVPASPTSQLSPSRLMHGGTPLPSTVRDYFEPRFGRDFSSVRIHTGEEAARANRELGSYAFTFGPHIWLGRGQDPGHSSLLAHELTHVVQQTAPPLRVEAQEQREPEPAEAQHSIQRAPGPDPLPPSSSVIRQDLLNGFALIQTPALGRGTLYYQDRIWVNFKWDPSTGPDERRLNVDLKIDLDPPIPFAPIPRLTLKIDVNFRVELQVNQGTEQFMADVAAQTILKHGGKMEVAIEAGDRGELNTFPAQGGPARSEPLPAKTLASYAPSPGAENQPLILHGEGDVVPAPPTPSAPDSPAPLLTTQQQVWIQKDQAAFEDFARKHPDTNWAAVTLPDGRVVAFALTEEVLHQAAERVRATDFRFPFQSPFPGSHVTGIVLHGRVLSSVNELENLYFSEDLIAAVGVEGDYEEAEVYAMAGHSFGRKPLTHAVALARWDELDAMPVSQIEKLETEPGHKFSMLWVRGLSQLHDLDQDHFSTRAKLLALPQGSLPSPLGPTDPMFKVLEVEADRTNPAAAIRTFLEKNEPTAETLQEKIVHRAETLANRFALQSLTHGMQAFDRIVKSDADAGVFLLTLAAASEDERHDMLVALGYGKLVGGVNPIVGGMDPMSAGTALGTQIVLSQEFKKTARVTSSKDNALRLILGETIEDTSLQSIRVRARDTRDGFQRTIDSLGDPDHPKVKMLYHEGDLGKIVRAQAYRQLGFTTLKPEDYPHGGQTKGFLPGPMSAGSFASIAEQMYANYASRHADVENLKLAAEIIAAIVITFLSEGFGGAIAGRFFAGSVVARTVVSGITFTALEAGLDAVLTGKVPTLAEFGGQALLNIAMFAFFKQLDTVIGAFSRSGVRTVFRLSEKAFAESTLAKGAANFGRLSGLSAVFTALSFEQFVIANGRLPNAREARRMAIKSVASIASMEVAGALIKSISSKEGLWGRAEKLDIKAVERKQMLDRLRGVNNDLLSTRLDPDQLNAKSPALNERYESILQDQKQLVNDLKPDLAKQGEPDAVNSEAADELARIDAALDALHQAKLVASANITPAGDPATAAEATEFTYTDTPESRKAIVDQFGASKTKIDPDGVITVNRADGTQLTIRPAPAGAQAAATTDPTVKPDTPAEKADPQKGDKSDETPADKDAPKPDPQAGAPAAPSKAASAAKPQDFYTRRDALVDRLNALRRRVSSTGLLDPVPEFGPGSARARPMTQAEVSQRFAAQNAIRGIAQRQPGRIRTTKGLAQQEAEVTQAERAAQPELDRLADLAFARHKERLSNAGLSLDNVRTGKLANLTDRQIGEALAQVPGAQGLHEAQLRGILFAAYGKGAGEFIDIQRVFDIAGSAAERNSVLDWFANLMEQEIPGTYEVLQTMTTNRNNWRGGLHVLDFAINGTGGTKVAKFEFPEGLSESGDMSEGGRIYDIVLVDGTRIQGKNWRNWFGVRSQYRRDVLLQTAKFANPNGLSRIRWIFRAPSPRPTAEIREVMRQTLEDTMTEFNVLAETRVKLRDAFNAHTGLVEEWAGTAFTGTPAAPPASATAAGTKAP
jgi:hypothetical protein